MKKLFFAVLFVVGCILAGTVNLQLTVGMLVALLSYLELRKQGVALDQIDDVIKDKIDELINQRK